MINRRLLASALLAALLATGCSNYTNRSLLIKGALVEADYDAALKNVEGIDRSTSELLYFYEKGIVLHYQDEYVASNEVFEQAELLLEDLYTKSVTRELAALAITDNIAKYRGDAHEAVLVNYYKILNYLHMGDFEGAAVECRRISGKLQRVRDAEGDYFENDPFLQYLTAMVYDAVGDRSDAEVSYRVARAAFDTLAAAYGIEAPPSLFCDAAANAYAVGDATEAESYEREAQCSLSDRDPKRTSVNVFLECGYVVHREEESVQFPILRNDDWSDDNAFAGEVVVRRGLHYERRLVDYWLKVSLPVLVATPVAFDYAVMRARTADGGVVHEVRSSTVENVDALASLAFREKETKIVVRAIVRALAKYAAKKKADKEDRGLGALVNLVGILTESADTRSWSTLPQRILMSRLELSAGTYDIEVTLHAADGTTHDTFVIPKVVVETGRPGFVNYRVH